MAGKNMRLNKVLKEFNISMSTAVDFLKAKGVDVEAKPTTKINEKVYGVLVEGFQSDKQQKEASKAASEAKQKEKDRIREDQERKVKTAQERREKEIIKAKAEVKKPVIKDTIELPSNKSKSTKKEVVQQVDLKDKPENKENKTSKKVEERSIENSPKQEDVVHETKYEKLGGLKLSGDKIELPSKKKESAFKKVENSIKSKAPSKKAVEKKVESKSVSQDKVVQKPEVLKESTAEKEKESEEVIKTNYTKLDGLKLTGQKVDLSQFSKKSKKKDSKSDNGNKGKRKRISNNKPANSNSQNRRGGANRDNVKGKGRFGNRKPQQNTGPKVEPTEAEIQKKIKDTLEKLTNKKGGRGAKHRRDRRVNRREEEAKQLEQKSKEKKTLKVTEFATVQEVATMMDVSVTDVISACMALGLMVTMNQRLDAETLSILAEEFNHIAEFVGEDVEEALQEVEDLEEDLEPRVPIITIMGHVDHGKTSLLDYIRNENVIDGEAGGITQHIGAYSVKIKTGEQIAFLDTPGHEAFTAMRARGAQVTDIVIIVIAADDDIMPQTKEAIAHSQAAEVPIIFAFNKVDKPTANPDNLRQQLASMNLLVESWGGKFQEQEISAKTGQGVPELLEKVLLEAELLELKANPNKKATGTVVEASLDKGKGYISTILVQGGTLKIGDYVLAGSYSGKVKAMQNEYGKSIKNAGPSTPVSLLGLDGAPQAGDKFKVFEDEREAKNIASKRSQLQREQSVRAREQMTLGKFSSLEKGEIKELNIILKGDVDGSVEALTDSLQKQSTEEILIKIVHKGVGQITESDIHLAQASSAIVIGFNVRPASGARSLAEVEGVEIRTYSIIYDAINEIKQAMEGMLEPEFVEEVIGNVEIRETFKISKIGTIAGCYVLNGKITRNSSVRILRDNVVIHQGELESLKRFKDDVKEVAKGYECGLNIKGFNDIKVEDVIEVYEMVEVKKKI